MKVIIFCGGKGTRLNKNLKKKILKPLLLVNKKPILKYIIEIYNKYIPLLAFAIYNICLKSTWRQKKTNVMQQQKQDKLHFE